MVAEEAHDTESTHSQHRWAQSAFLQVSPRGDWAADLDRKGWCVCLITARAVENGALPPDPDWLGSLELSTHGAQKCPAPCLPSSFPEWELWPQGHLW